MEERKMFKLERLKGPRKLFLAIHNILILMWKSSQVIGRDAVLLFVEGFAGFWVKTIEEMVQRAGSIPSSWLSSNAGCMKGNWGWDKWLNWCQEYIDYTGWTPLILTSHTGIKPKLYVEHQLFIVNYCPMSSSASYI